MSKSRERSDESIPLSERLNQDVIHDNFIPRYGALSSARPKRIVLVGVWLIFGPLAIAALGMGIATLSNFAWSQTSELMISLALFAASATILVTQTKRYITHRMAE